MESFSFNEAFSLNEAFSSISITNLLIHLSAVLIVAKWLTTPKSFNNYVKELISWEYLKYLKDLKDLNNI